MDPVAVFSPGQSSGSIFSVDAISRGGFVCVCACLFQDRVQKQSFKRWHWWETPKLPLGKQHLLWRSLKRVSHAVNIRRAFSHVPPRGLLQQGHTFMQLRQQHGQQKRIQGHSWESLRVVSRSNSSNCEVFSSHLKFGHSSNAPRKRGGFQCSSSWRHCMLEKNEGWIHQLRLRSQRRSFVHVRKASMLEEKAGCVL